MGGETWMWLLITVVCEQQQIYQNVEMAKSWDFSNKKSNTKYSLQWEWMHGNRKKYLQGKAN